LFWETWLAGKINRNVLQIPDENHLTVNGYANSWIIDPDEICKNEGFCRKNGDGSYDMELIVEFWPQRLFYIGLGISGLTLLFCIVYLVRDGIISRKKYQGKYIFA